MRAKIFNDPVYGFISVPHGLVFELLEHPFFQRLSRIKQLGLTYYVYPGAIHTRFHHALGAMHLMQQAIFSLREKGVEISERETEAACCAVLLHDIGHGPFSHALEHRLVCVHHEVMTQLFMHQLNAELGGRLGMAIEIFEDRHDKPFLHQLVSGQLDVDRMDYLARDSFFTGVQEGVISYDRILKMLDVRDGRLVVEEKGLYSIENFLSARRLMYWQAYLHKTSLSAEHMLIHVVERARTLCQQGILLPVSRSLFYFLTAQPGQKEIDDVPAEMARKFASLDDFDIVSALKEFVFEDDFALSKLSEGIINRRLLKVIFQDEPYGSDFIESERLNLCNLWNIDMETAAHFVFTSAESNSSYSSHKDEILILMKNGTVRPFSSFTEFHPTDNKVTRYFFFSPHKVFKNS